MDIKHRLYNQVIITALGLSHAMKISLQLYGVIFSCNVHLIPVLLQLPSFSIAKHHYILGCNKKHFYCITAHYQLLKSEL